MSALSREELSTKPTRRAKVRKRRAHTAEGAAITDLVLGIFRTNGTLMRSGDGMMRDLGVSSARWQVMGAIKDRPRTVAQIARFFESTRQGVLWVVTALVKDGLVELIDNPDHKRAKLVQFTDRGREVNEEIERRQIAWANQLGARFSLAEIRNATEVLKRLSNSVSD